MIFVIFVIVVLVVVFGPGLWVNRVLDRYSVPADRYSGTGGALFGAFIGLTIYGC